MSNRLVINSGPLITLARAQLLDVVGKLPVEFVCPEEVHREILEGTAKGHPEALPSWVTPLSLSLPVHSVVLTNLDLGEAAVIQLALEKDIDWVCIDDLKGRRAALAAGLQVTGSLGLLAAARTLGIIPSLRSLVQKLIDAGGYYDDQLVQNVLRDLGEDGEE